MAHFQSRSLCLLILAIVAVNHDCGAAASTSKAAASPQPVPIVVPAWAYPQAGQPAAPEPAGTPPALLSIPGSKAQFTRAQVNDLFAPPDWYPGDHPPMPEVVAHGRKPTLYACGFCHLPNGSGRPENSNLAGLPADYIEQQVAAFRDGSRKCASTEAYLPFIVMQQVAKEATPQEVAEAAAYFSRLRLPSKLTVREVDLIAKPRAENYIYALEVSKAVEPLAGRIIEMIEDMRLHELRDEKAPYIAYVPIGSIARGKKLATAGPDGPATSCFVCHDNDLRGTAVAPPLAGQYASYVFRQLLAFRLGTRTVDPEAMMTPVVAKLSVDDMVDLSAFIAAQKR